MNLYKYVVYLPNDADVLRDEEDRVLYFQSVCEVERYIFNRDDRAELPIYRSVGICPHCGKPLFWPTNGHGPRCFDCGEEFYSSLEHSEKPDLPLYFGEPTNAEYECEQVEACPYCGYQENLYPNHIPEKDGYKALCAHCGKEILLCDACLHAEDNAGGLCSWTDEVGCFRNSKSH